MGKKFFVVGFRRVFVERESGKREKERKKKKERMPKGTKTVIRQLAAKEKKGNMAHLYRRDRIITRAGNKNRSPAPYELFFVSLRSYGVAIKSLW